MRQILHYLKRHHVTDIQVINRLFVSMFVVANKLKVSDNSYLRDYLVGEDEDNSRYLVWILRRIREKNLRLGLEELISLFEFVISPSDRIITGAIYTPKSIRGKIINQCLGVISAEKLTESKVADISCGCGGFLMDAALFIHQQTGKSFTDIYRDNLFGIDVEPYSIERTKIVLALLGLINGEDEVFEFNLLCADTLSWRSEFFDERYRHFDIIIGNPPYVCSRNMTDDIRSEALTYEVCRYGHPDLYIPFIQIAIDSLNTKGRLGYITMNSFFNSLNGRGLREYLDKKRIRVEIVDFHGYQVFNSRSTYTCLLFVNNIPAKNISYASAKNGDVAVDFHFEQIAYSNLDAAKGWNLRWATNAIKYETVGMSLGKYCASRHGIATLSNKTYIFKPQSENVDVYLLENNGISYPIERTICRDIVNSNKLNSEAGFDSLVEKVIFPYRIDESGKSIIYSEAEMQALFPLAMKYLQSQRDALEQRDKGGTDAYPTWYAYGRTQSLVMPRYKLFFPKIANKPLKCVLKDAPHMLLYNGMAFVSDDIRQLQVLKCFMESDVFWNYVSSTAKPYSSGFYSLNGVNIKKFGIPQMDSEQTSELLAIENLVDRNTFISELYGAEHFYIDKACGKNARV